MDVSPYELATRSCSGLLKPSPADEAGGAGDEGVVEFCATFPAVGETSELVEEDEGLLDDVAELARALDARGAATGDDRQHPALSQFAAVRVGVVALATEQDFGTPPRAAGAIHHERDAVDQGEGLGTSLTLAAAVMNFSGVPRPSQIR
ncbi:hypothetical protein [Streptomyces venezuelae]|uniref:hypothetical protein n=1 Tax=Streptomyces venezuelae TaxID=54571 RepID=UPI00278C65A9|nr:hypothetical protein [Streptomyces venezuelae]